MIRVRRANERGHFSNDWLNSRHTFSFGDYYDPQQMGVSALRVINDDRVMPGKGFATHAHKNMEIVSYVLEGELAHKDSMGNGSIIRPGDVQRMSAGSGVTHSEFNPSDKNPTHFLQIWLLPNKRDVEPGYQQKFFAPEDKSAQLRLLVSQDGRDGSISAHTDALMYSTILDGAHGLTHAIESERMVYVHVAKGEATIQGEQLSAGDGMSITDESKVLLSGDKGAEVLLFDLPGKEK